MHFTPHEITMPGVWNDGLMDSNSVPGRLIGSEVHGFCTMEDLDIGNMMEEAKARWLRQNEIHAILCNHKYFTVNVKPVNLPKSGTIVLFDRKKLRNFRKDGHNWKKKKDRKNVEESHDHLKVGNEKRINVYYARREGDPTFVRRCYWLLDKSLEHIVLVHYRETQELQGSPAIPGSLNSNSAESELPATRPLFEESDFTVNLVYNDSSISHLGRNDSMTIENHEQRLHEINTLAWDELLVQDDPHKLNSSQEGSELPNQYQMNSYRISDYALSTNKLSSESPANGFPSQVAGSNSIKYNIPNNLSNQAVGREEIVNSEAMISQLVPLGGTGSSQNLGEDGLQAQDNFARFMAQFTADSPASVTVQALESSILTGDEPFTYPMMDNRQTSPLGQIFNITDVSPAWALSTEETKILVVGFFNERNLPDAESQLYLACGDSILPAEEVQAGVYRCLISPRTPGLVDLYLTFDRQNPISQVLTFEFRSPEQQICDTNLFKNRTDWEEFQLQMRLAHLLFSSSRGLSIRSTLLYLSKMIEDTRVSSHVEKDRLFELTLQSKLEECLLEKVVAGCKVSECDEHGQGVIHLCAILDYTWAVYRFTGAGLSLDYRDKYGWTALHWAAYYGREKMVAALLSAGAKPNLVTDPTSQNPGRCTAADLASKKGYEGLAAYLAEKALVAQFMDTTLAGNVSGSLQTTTNDTVNPGNFSEEELYPKDTLAAHRTAAARIQAAFREHSLKMRTKAVESSNPEIEARNLVAAMKIQHTFRNYEARKYGGCR